MKTKYILFSLVWFSMLSCDQNYYILNNRLDFSGFFSIFHNVLGALEFMETDPSCCGLGVDFEDSGFYHDEEHGDNWWEYYFEPIDVGTKTSNVKKFPYYKQIMFSLSSQFGMSRERGHELIKKYAILKPHIQEKIDTFVKNNFKDATIIGIHYRGTDKCAEADIVSYKDAQEAILPLIEKGDKASKIFIATDDPYFVPYMMAHFPGKIITTNVIRSDGGMGVHYAERNRNYQKGEEALIDCILLSRCNIFVKMDSNLSDCAIKFNPRIPIIELNQKDGEDSFTVDPPSPSDTYALIDSVNVHPDIFRQLGIVLSVLEQYENNTYTGVKIDFEKEGEYYSPHKGNNWWQYFFEPLEVGDVSRGCKRVPRREKAVLGCSLLEKSPQKMHDLIQKHINIQPEITEKVSKFRQEHLQDSFVIGVHYTSSSPWYKSPKINYKDFYDVILVHLTKRNNTKVLVHTNDKKFYSFLKVKHPDSVLRYKKAEHCDSKADTAENELANCLLLSQTDQLLCTPSRFSLAISWFNPKLPVTEFGVNPELKTESTLVKLK